MRYLKKPAAFFTALCLFSTFACAPKKSVGTELVFWHVGTEQETQIINDLARGFTKETGIKVRCEAISWGEAHSKYLVAIVGGVTPDIGTMSMTWATEYGLQDAMVDLAQDYPAELKTIQAQTFPADWAVAEYKGNVYSVPFDITTQIMYYRSDIVKEPPKTWKELKDLIAKLQNQKKNILFEWGSMEWIGYAPFLWQAGGDFYNKDKTQSALNSPQAVEALGFFTDLYTKYKIPKSERNIALGLRTGEYPLGITGNWLINSLNVDAPEIEGKWKIALLPAGPTGKRTAFIGGRGMGIFKKSKHQQEAWKLVQFFSRADIQVKLYQEVGKTVNIYLPPNLNVWDKLPMKAEFREILREQILDAKGPPTVLGWNDSTRFIVEAIQEVVIKGGIAEDVLKKAAMEMDKRIVK